MQREGPEVVFGARDAVLSGVANCNHLHCHCRSADTQKIQTLIAAVRDLSTELNMPPNDECPVNGSLMLELSTDEALEAKVKELGGASAPTVAPGVVGWGLLGLWVGPTHVRWAHRGSRPIGCTWHGTKSRRQLLGAADAQTAHHATFSTAPTHQLLGSVNAETTPAGAPAAAANRTQ